MTQDEAKKRAAYLTDLSEAEGMPIVVGYNVELARELRKLSIFGVSCEYSLSPYLSDRWELLVTKVYRGARWVVKLEHNPVDAIDRDDIRDPYDD